MSAPTSYIINRTASNGIEPQTTTSVNSSLVNTDHPHYIYLVLVFGILSGCVLCGILLWIKNKAPKWIKNKAATTTVTKLAQTLSGTKQDQKNIVAEDSVSNNESDEHVLEEILSEVEEMKSFQDTDQSILQSVNKMNTTTLKGGPGRNSKRVSNMHNLDTPALLAQQQEGKRISKMLELSKIKDKSFEVLDEGNETNNNNDNEDIETDDWPIVPSFPDSYNVIDRTMTAASTDSLYGTYEEIGLIPNGQMKETPQTPAGDMPMKNIVIVTNKGNGSSDDDDENIPAAPAPPNMNVNVSDDGFSDDYKEEDDESSSYEQMENTFSEKNNIAESNSKLLKILPMSMSNNKRVSDMFKFDAVDTFSKLNEKYAE